jgi:N-acetylglucosamine kinase-like BadF-type ATPase
MTVHPDRAEQRQALVLAVDGGQSHSLAVLAELGGHVLGAGKGGPANHFLEPGGETRFRCSMSGCIGGAFASAGLPQVRMAASYYALTGVHAQMHAILQEIAPSKRQIVAGDKDASLVGGTLERPAALVLAGTGAIACAVDQDGCTAMTGGWGYVMGDEGSASWIAPRALSAATQAEDGRGPATQLTHTVPAYFGVQNLRALHPLIYTQQIDRVRLAGVTRVVGEAAQTGDAVAVSIMAEAGKHLGNAAVAVIRALRLQAMAVALTSAGGCFKAGAVLVEPMMARVHEECPLVYYQSPRFPPVIGALFLALQSIGVPVTEDVIANVHSSRVVWEDRK